MTSEKTIINYHQLKVDVEREAGEDLLRHLKTSVLGTPGGLRYKHTQTEDKIRNLGETYFLLLRKSGRMLGSVGLCFRQTFFADVVYVSWYVRYFAIKAPLKSSQPKSEKLLENSGRGLSLLRQTAAPYLQKPGENLKNFPQGSEKSLVYAYIEQQNFQSVQFAQQNDFETVRKFATFVFSRFIPRKNKNVFSLQDFEKEDVRSLLKIFYRSHTLYCEQNLFYHDNYVVYKDQGRIVAGMQSNPDRWEIKEMGGLFGKFLVNIFPRIPFLGRLFNTRKLDFVAADYIFWETGYEHAVSALFETSCALNNRNILMAWSDTDGSLLKVLDKHVKQGIIGSSLKRFEVDIKVKFNGYKEEEKDFFYRNPSFVSSFDVT